MLLKLDFVGLGNGVDFLESIDVVVGFGMEDGMTDVKNMHDSCPCGTPLSHLCYNYIFDSSFCYDGIL